MRDIEATDAVEELLIAAGFDNHLEWRDLLLCVPLDTPDQRVTSEEWLEHDGTKAGLSCSSLAPPAQAGDGQRRPIGQPLAHELFDLVGLLVLPELQSSVLPERGKEGAERDRARAARASGLFGDPPRLVGHAVRP